jgi:hypothetical protein
MYKSTDVIFIKTIKRGFIPQLRMNGPIVSPMRASIAQCLAMLTANIPLYQYDPTTKRVVELTIANLVDDQKFIAKVGDVKDDESTLLPQVDVRVSSKNNTENSSALVKNKKDWNTKEFNKGQPVKPNIAVEPVKMNTPEETAPLKTEETELGVEESPEVKNDKVVEEKK